jgi:hypothetical protein
VKGDMGTTLTAAGMDNISKGFGFINNSRSVLAFRSTIIPEASKIA